MIAASCPPAEARTVHPLLASAFGALDAAGVRWCLLRDEDELDGSSGDVDLLVARADFDAARRVLARTGFARLPARGHGSHAFFLAYDPEDDLWLWLDVVTDVRFGEYQTLRVPAEAELLARRERRGGVPVLARGDAFWMLLLHCLLDKDAVPAKHRPAVQRLVGEASGSGQLPALLDAAALSLVRAGDWAELDELGRRLRRELTDRPARTAAARAVRAATRLLQGLVAPAPMVVLLGPDGAGKSTLAEGLRRSFATYEARVVYMGLYRGTRSRLLLLPGVYVASRIALAWARYLVASFHRAAGRLVVLDRHVYDVAVPPPVPLGPGQRAHRWLVAHSLPAPDLVLVLDLPPAASLARRPDEDRETLERLREGYLQLSARLPRAHVLDASADAETVRRRAVSLVWRACAGRLDRG